MRPPTPALSSVLRGAEDGLTSVGARSWHQGSPGVPGANEVDDAFGWALAVADLDADTNPDLAIGAQRESIGTIPGAGAVTLLNGTAGGLSAAGALSWSQNSAGIPGGAESEDRFGYLLRSLPGPPARPVCWQLRRPSRTSGQSTGWAPPPSYPAEQAARFRCRPGPGHPTLSPPPAHRPGGDGAGSVTRDRARWAFDYGRSSWPVETSTSMRRCVGEEMSWPDRGPGVGLASCWRRRQCWWGASSR